MQVLNKMLPVKQLVKKLLFAGVCALSFFNGSLQAQWLQVTGSAVIKEGQYEQARAAAQADALRKASLEFGGQIKSSQRMRQGELVEDLVRFDAQAKLRRAEVQEEYVANGALYLVMNVDLERVQSCPNSQAAGYKKAVALMGFALQSPRDAMLGGLANIERGLASALNASLLKQNSLLVMSASHNRLFADLRDAPTRYAEQGHLTQTTHVASELGAQFVISGVIRDLGFEDPEHFENSAWRSLLRVSKLSNPTRRFSVDVFVHDGFSGSIIWQQNFATAAPWNLELEDQVGFGSARFWQDSYGQAVQAQVDTMAYLIAEQLRCQPFMTRISRVAGKTLHFDSGARTGIRPGDKFSLYRTYSFYDANRVSGIELQNAKTALTVSQVHPEFASGTIGVEPGRINIQEDDLLIAW